MTPGLPGCVSHVRLDSSLIWLPVGCPLSGEGREGLAAIAEVHHAAHVSRRRPLFPDALDGVLQLQEKGSARKFPRPWGAEAA